MVSRIVRLIIFTAIGIALGLVYGWIIDPVEYVDITPEILRADYRADYILMVAESFKAEGDPGLAAQRLGLLGSALPDQLVAGALEFARLESFSPAEIGLLADLLTAMQTYHPAPGMP